MELRLRFKKPKKRTLAVAALILIVLAVGARFYWTGQEETIPQQISSQLNFKPIQPSKNLLPSGAGADNFTYNPEQKVLIFTINFEGKSIVVSEQHAPDNLAIGTEVYFKAIGLRPVAEFESNIGPSAVANFYESGSLIPSGQAAIAVAGDTMLIAKTVDPKQKLTNDQWKQLLDSLK